MQTFKYGYKTLMAHVVILLLSSFLLANTPVTQYLNEDPASSAERRTNYDWEPTCLLSPVSSSRRNYGSEQQHT